MTENTNIRQKLICPICASPFNTDGKSLICDGERHHLFDFSSSGYVNLLSPGRNRNSKSGDDAEMISARRRFLSAGYYDAISEAVGSVILSDLTTKCKEGAFHIDSGSGEGYHTLNIAETVANGGKDILSVGFDASKKGASAGAVNARLKGIHNPFLTVGQSAPKVFFAAGNIFSLPVKSHSADYVTSLFAPIAAKENKRVLKDDGLLIVAASGAHHLFELRELLYDSVILPSGNVKCPEGFTKAGEQTLKYHVKLKNNSEIQDLFKMTPFYYRTSLADKAKLQSILELEITVEVLICSFRPTESI